MFATQESTMDGRHYGSKQGTCKHHQSLSSANFVIPITFRIRIAFPVMSLVSVPRILASWWNLPPLVHTIHLRAAIPVSESVWSG